MGCRILITASTFPVSEQDTCARFVLDLALQLKIAGFEVEVLAPESPTPSPDASGITVHRFRYAPWRSLQLISGRGIWPRLKHRPWLWFLVPSFLFCEAIAYRRLIRRYRPDCVLANWLIPQALIASYFTPTPIPVISLCHGTDARLLSWLPWHRRRLRQQTVVAASHYLKRQLTERWGFLTARVEVIPPFVAESVFNAPKRPVPQRPVVAFLGRVDAGKGLSVLKAAWPAVLRQEPQAELRLYSNYSVSSLANLLREVALVVVPSVQAEGLGIVAVEAQLLGIPVIVSDVGGLSETLVDRTSGMLIPANDPQALAEAIQLLLRDPRKRHEMGEAARNQAKIRFDPAKLTEQWRELILSRATVS